MYTSAVKDNAERLEADSVLINSRIITLDCADSIAEAVAIKNGKIIKVGSNVAIKEFIGYNTLVIDLKGLTATPGLIDSHNHFPGASSLYILNLNYPNVKSISDIVEMVKKHVQILNPGEWVLGSGWDEEKLAENRFIYASDLDPVTPNNPVWLAHSSFHFGVANSFALNLAKITRETPDPQGGIIDRNSDGTPTGLLRESPAMDLVRRLIPPFTEEQEIKGLKHMCKQLNQEGVTAIIDPGIGFLEAAEGGGLIKWNRYKKLLEQDVLSVRVFVLWLSGRSEKEAQELINHLRSLAKNCETESGDMLISGGVKMFLDGVPGTAWVYEEWNKNFSEKDPGNYGSTVIDPEVFRRLVKMYHSAGLHIEVHAVGDRAVDWVLESYIEALWEKTIKGLRHGIIHADVPTDRAIEWMAALQKSFDVGYVYAQPSLMWWLGDYSASYYGPKRSLKYCPLRTYLEKGIIWGAGSDHPVNPLPPRIGIWASVARQSLLSRYGKNVFGNEQSIDVKSALRSYTKWNAYLMFMEKKLGSIEIGKYADIAVWDKDIYTIPVDEIKNLKCLMTMLNGRIVYKAPEAPIETYKAFNRSNG
ncbi:MAG: amidohydrolase [Candidatus Bathyarchaeia archaeon]